MNGRGHVRYIVVVGIGAVIALWILRIPLSGALPLAFLLVCGVMMFVMMRAMDHSSHEEAAPQDRPTEFPGKDGSNKATTQADAAAVAPSQDQIALIDRQYRD